MIETMERRKESLIAAIWANDGFNDDKGTRQNAIQEIEASYEEALSGITGAKQAEEQEIDKDNPFFAQMYKGMEKIHSVQQNIDPDVDVEAVIKQEEDFSRFIDQS